MNVAKEFDDKKTNEESTKRQCDCRENRIKDSGNKTKKSAVKSVIKKSPETENKQEKKVSFADYDGSELVNIRTFVPSSDDLSQLEFCYGLEDTSDMKDDLEDALLMTSKMFEAAQKTGWKFHFSLHYDWEITRNILNSQNVHLEFARVIRADHIAQNPCFKFITESSDGNSADSTSRRAEKLPVLIGTIRVKNLNFEKKIFVRHSFDKWNSQFDLKAKFSRHCPYNNTDCFDFFIRLDHSKYHRIDFAILYQTKEEEYWDSNHGKNFTITYEP